MYEGSRDEDACSEVSREKEELVWNGDARKALDDDREGASGRTQKENQEKGEDVDCRVVAVFVSLAPTSRSFILLPSAQLSAQDVCGYFRP